MNETNSSKPFHLRDFRAEDIPDFVEAINLGYPEEPTTIEQVEYWESSFPSDVPRRRAVAEWQDGKTAGFATCFDPFWMVTPGAYWLELLVHPSYRRQGAGRELLAAVEPFAWQQGAQRLWTNGREDHLDGAAFAGAHGYHRIGIRFESTLDLDTFDEEPFVAAFDRIRAAGYTLTTFADERARVADADRRLYDLYDEIMVDVPFPGGAYPKTTYEQWRAWTLDSPISDTEAMFLAKQGDEWVGLTLVEIPPVGTAFTGSTGVLRAHRGRGLAMALKLHSFRFLRERGQHEVRAHNDTANPPILNLNEKLGYRRLPGWISWEKLNPSSR
ncbi:MAG: GNAT family N-acetyltransferase [Anaerolineae bacterium]|nr:GNAT family N-acetyltransferase [Anaerolineae bacterium]